MFFKSMDGYKLYYKCRACGSSDIESVINLGTIPLAGGFLKSRKEIVKEKKYPLTLAFCENCYLLQTREVIPADKLFKNYFYFSSAIKTLVSHFQEKAHEFSQQFSSQKHKMIIEIGCNDGSFLQACMKESFNTVGVDPATNIVKPLIEKGVPIINKYFTQSTAKQIKNKYGKADIIFSSNTLAHIENIHDVFKGIESLLKDDGILVFENHYLGNLIHQMQYDMIYHEHQYYYSLTTLKNLLNQHNMEIFDIKFIPIHSGSISVYAQKKKGSREIEKIVSKTIENELINKLTNKETFINYNKKIKKTKKNLIELIHSVKKRNKTIAGYGASGRGTIIMNYCGLGTNFLDYVIDDAPAKQGAYTPGTHLLIKDSSVLNTKKRPDFVLLFAWPFWEEIRKKNQEYLDNGGRFIIPLPKVKII